MKHVEACLSAIEDRESSFDHFGSTVMLVQACLCSRKTWERRFHLRGGAVNHVQACLSAREDRESSFHHCGGRVMLVLDCLSAGKT